MSWCISRSSPAVPVPVLLLLCLTRPWVLSTSQQRRRPNTSLLAGHLARAVQGRVPVITNLLLPKRQEWLLLLPTGGIVTLPVENDTHHSQAHYCFSTCLQPHRALNQNPFQVNINWNEIHGIVYSMQLEQIRFNFPFSLLWQLLSTTNTAPSTHEQSTLLLILFPAQLSVVGDFLGWHGCCRNSLTRLPG